jgi:hypothetical protein
MMAVSIQRKELNRRIREYAKNQHNNKYGVGWYDFERKWYEMYHTDLRRELAKYQQTHKLKRLTLPEYLERSGKLDQAVKVAERLGKVGY